ncbi:hypothetical protein ACFTAO_20665 [Paenibacillus rhizoplanae]
MFLAIREMRHSKARYSLIMVIMLLVSFLVLFVTGLARGLAYANISALKKICPPITLPCRATRIIPSDVHS